MSKVKCKLKMRTCGAIALPHPDWFHCRSTSSLRKWRDPPTPTWIATRRRPIEPRPRPLLETLMSAFTAAMMPFTSAHWHLQLVGHSRSASKTGTTPLTWDRTNCHGHAGH